ncbi:MAG: hypothetical protein P1U34_11785 [Coxiellaceae bacterium]|nr:hypothetical protein [Coxiellaceae bacterium]
MKPSRVELEADSEVSDTTAKLKARLAKLRGESAGEPTVDEPTVDEKLDAVLSKLRRPPVSNYSRLFQLYIPENRLHSLSGMRVLDRVIPRLCESWGEECAEILVKAQSDFHTVLRGGDFSKALQQFEQLKWRILNVITPDYCRILSPLEAAADEIEAELSSKKFLLLDDSPLVHWCRALVNMLPSLVSRFQALVIHCKDMEMGLAGLRQSIDGLVYFDAKKLADGLRKVERIMSDFDAVKYEINMAKEVDNEPLCACIDGFSACLDDAQSLFDRVYQPLLKLVGSMPEISEVQREMVAALHQLGSGLAYDKRDCDTQMGERIGALRCGRVV